MIGRSGIAALAVRRGDRDLSSREFGRAPMATRPIVHLMRALDDALPLTHISWIVLRSGYSANLGVGNKTRLRQNVVAARAIGVDSEGEQRRGGRIVAEALTSKHCVPCEGGIPALSDEEIAPLLAQLDGWVVVGGKRLAKTYRSRISPKRWRS